MPIELTQSHRQALNRQRRVAVNFDVGYPANHFGPGYFKDLLAPMPQLRLMPNLSPIGFVFCPNLIPCYFSHLKLQLLNYSYVLKSEQHAPWLQGEIFSL